MGSFSLSPLSLHTPPRFNSDRGFEFESRCLPSLPVSCLCLPAFAPLCFLLGAEELRRKTLSSAFSPWRSCTELDLVRLQRLGFARASRGSGSNQDSVPHTHTHTHFFSLLLLRSVLRRQGSDQWSGGRSSRARSMSGGGGCKAKDTLSPIYRHHTHLCFSPPSSRLLPLGLLSKLHTERLVLSTTLVVGFGESPRTWLVSVSRLLRAAPLVRVKANSQSKTPYAVAEDSSHTAFLTVIFTLTRTSGVALTYI